MFLGRYQHSLDEKGRLTIPAAFRETLSGGAFISRGFDRNLMVMTTASFELVYQRVNATSLTDLNARMLRRLLLSDAYQVDLDRNGRILVPSNLREVLNINGELVLVGVGEFFEVWTAADWSKQMETLQDTDANAQRFAMLDLSTSQ